MNIQQLIYVVEVNNKHSFSEAARSLFVTQPALSRTIHNLEQELGFEIFERSRKGVSATTTKGYQFIKEAQDILKLFSDLERFKTDPATTFHLCSTVISQAENAFINLCQEFMETPDLDIELIHTGCHESSERICDGVSDLAVVTITSNQLNDWETKFREMNISFEEIASFPFNILVNKNSKLADNKCITAEDLKDHTYVAERCQYMNNLQFGVYDYFDKIFPASRITLNNTDMTYTLISSSPDSKVFALDPLPLSAEAQERYSLRSIPFDTELLVHIGIIYRSISKPDGIAKRYIQLFKEELENCMNL